MSDRRALLAAVLADPDADAPRLVYADFLDETGDPTDAARAAFIRLEIEAARLPADDPARERLETEAARLFNRHGEAWNRELPGWERWYDSHLTYRRGFPEGLATLFRRFIIDGRELFSAAPLRALALSPGRGYVTSVRMAGEVAGGLPDLGRIVDFALGPGIRLHGPVAEPLADWLGGYPTLTGVRTLRLGGNGLTDEQVGQLAPLLPDTPFFHTLESLDLSDNAVTSAGATFLAAVPGLDALRELILTGNRLGTIGEQALRNRFGDRVRL
jgi:uncharacterized protein (TIGR02996 family)